MTTTETYKKACLDGLHERLYPSALALYRDDQKAAKDKAEAINALIKAERSLLLNDLPREGSGVLRIVAEYCASVVSLEYRNMLWPYDYMALSRRVGELWERTCRAPWDSPETDQLTPLPAPKFTAICADIRDRFRAMTLPGAETRMEKLLSQVFGLVGNINMKADGVHCLDGAPLVVDFKSGFGSNEKGNTERLQRVGRAYRIWNPDTRLLLLVRQRDHHAHYLAKLEAEGIWEVHYSSDAYRVMHETTGTDVGGTLDQVVRFDTDLSPRFWERLRSTGQDLDRYFDWRGQ